MNLFFFIFGLKNSIYIYIYYIMSLILKIYKKFFYKFFHLIRNESKIYKIFFIYNYYIISLYYNKDIF